MLTVIVTVAVTHPLHQHSVAPPQDMTLHGIRIRMLSLVGLFFLVHGGFAADCDDLRIKTFKVGRLLAGRTAIVGVALDATGPRPTGTKRHELELMLPAGTSFDSFKFSPRRVFKAPAAAPIVSAQGPKLIITIPTLPTATQSKTISFKVKIQVDRCAPKLPLVFGSQVRRISSADTVQCETVGPRPQVGGKSTTLLFGQFGRDDVLHVFKKYPLGAKGLTWRLIYHAHKCTANGQVPQKEHLSDGPHERKSAIDLRQIPFMRACLDDGMIIPLRTNRCRPSRRPGSQLSSR